MHLRDKLKVQYLHSLHHSLHLGYLCAVFIESSYFYAKIAGALFICTAFMLVGDRVAKKRNQPPKAHLEDL